MERYAYVNCQSELYIKDEQIETDKQCPMCGECDEYLGCFETTAELAMLMWLNKFSGQDILDKTGYIITFKKEHDVELDKEQDYMDLTYSDKFKDYIEVQNDVGYPQTIYKFPNGYGASVIDFKLHYLGIEIIVLRFDEEGNREIDYTTTITNDVIRGLDEEGRDKVLKQIFDLENQVEE